MSDSTSDPPPSRGKQFVDRLNAYRNIILATAALATAIGSWLRPTDTSATKQSFDWTTEKVQELARTDVQMHDDIVALRAYLEGMRAAQVPTPAPVAAAVAPGRRSGAGRPARPVAFDLVNQVLQEPVQAPEPVRDLPALKSAPHDMARPDFEDVLAE